MLIWYDCGLIWDGALQSDKETEQERLEEALDQTMEQVAALQVRTGRKFEALKSCLWPTIAFSKEADCEAAL